jgi:hypothetical protein
MNIPEVITWKHWKYAVKPFTPRVYFQIAERLYADNEEGRVLSGPRSAAAELLLKPLDNPSQIALNTGALVDSLFDEAEDVEGAIRFGEMLSFLSTDYVNRGNKLIASAKDLDAQLLRKAEPSNPQSPDSTPNESDTSGPAEAT